MPNKIVVIFNNSLEDSFELGHDLVVKKAGFKYFFNLIDSTNLWSCFGVKKTNHKILVSPLYFDKHSLRDFAYFPIDEDTSKVIVDFSYLEFMTYYNNTSNLSKSMIFYPIE